MDGLCFRKLFKEVVISLVYKGALVGVLVSAEGERIYVLDPRVVLIVLFWLAGDWLTFVGVE